MIRKTGAAVMAAMMFMALLSGCSKEALAFTKAPRSISGSAFNNASKIEDVSDLNKTGYVDFAVDTFGKCCSDNNDNVLISPASLLFAMEMAGAGANGNTLDEIQTVLMKDRDNADTLGYAAAYFELLEWKGCLRVANGAFINEDFEGSIYKEYCDYIEYYFDAEIDVTSFDEEGTGKINDWVSRNTKGMVPSIIDSPDPNEQLMLINTIAFDASWAHKYREDDVLKDSTFTDADGNKEDVSLMFSREGVYIETDKVTGFIKPYESGYSFMALLPKDDSVSANEFMRDFSGSDYLAALDSRKSAVVESYLPEFSYDYSCDSFKDIFRSLGINDAFSPDAADFSNMSDRDLFISRVIQKTHIEVDKDGTRAAAATAAGCMTSGSMTPTETYEVRLDRPFIYVIVDNETMTPLFLGTVNSVNS